jgi:WD40 repeat protein/energy-coupling factor transporter ATP-binding protein EcfA2
MVYHCPYPGLRPFQPDEAHIFFGREEQTDELLRRLKDGHFLAIVGSSGCGKSSLVRAGLIPALETGFMGSEGPLWLCVQMRPGTRPMRELAEALLESKALVQHAEQAPQDADRNLALGLLMAQLRRGPLGLVEALRLSPRALTPAVDAGTAMLTPMLNDMAESGPRDGRDSTGETRSAPRRNLLVLVDQFEEIFRFRQESSVDEAVAFVALLLQTAHEAELQQLPIYVVTTMRSDFIGDCALFDGLPEALNRGQYLAPRLHREQLRQAIIGPARVFGGDVQPELVALLLNEIGSDQDQLPILQHLLMRMWTWRGHSGSGAKKVLTLDDYRDVGGLQNALSKHADEAFHQRLDPPQQRIAEIMFRQISELGEDGRAIRRPTEAGRIADLAGTTLAEVEKVVNVFRDPQVSFLMPPLPDPVEPDTKLDISHESLIRQWGRLCQWVRSEADKVQRYRGIVRDATKYEKGEAHLYFGGVLDGALKWRDKQKPNMTWAEAYGTQDEFRRFENFLKKSKEAEQAEQVRREAHRRQILHAWQLAAATCAVFFIFAAIAAGWAIASKRDVAEQKAKVVAGSANLETAEGDRRVAILALLDVLPDPDASTNPLSRALRWLTLNDPPVVDEAVRALGQASYLPIGRVLEIPGQRLPFISVLFPADDVLIVLTEQSAHRLDLATGDAMEIKFEAPESMSLSPDGRYLLTMAQGVATIWKLHADEKIEKVVDWQAGNNGGRAVGTFGPNGKIATVSFLGGGVKLWSWTVGTNNTPEALPVELSVPEQDRHNLEKDSLRINSVAFDATGKRLVTTSWTGIIRIWDANTGRPRYMMKMNGPNRQARFNPNSQQVAVVSASGTYLWDLARGSVVQPLTGGGKEIRSAEFSPDGTRILTSSLDGMAAVWDTSDGRLLRVFQGPYQPGARRSAAVFSPDGRQIAAVFSTSRTFVWNVDPADKASRMCQLPLRLPSKPQSPLSATVTALDLSQEGHVVTAFDHSVSVWDCAARSRDLPQTSFEKPVMDVAFSPADTSLMTASGNDVLIWDIHTRTVLDKLQGPSAQERLATVLAVAHDREGNRIATGSQDKTARVWDARSRRELHTFEHDAPVVSVGLSPNGERLVTADANRSIRVWSAESGDLLHETNAKVWPSDGEVWPTDLQFRGKEQVLITTTGPWVLAAKPDNSPSAELPAAEPPRPDPRFQPSYQRWEWNFSNSDKPEPMRGDVWLSTSTYNILIDENDGETRLAPLDVDVLHAGEREGFAGGELALPMVDSPIKFVSVEFQNNKLVTLSTDGTVQVNELLPIHWADVVRNARKTVATWDEDLRTLSRKERKRLGLEEEP